MPFEEDFMRRQYKDLCDAMFSKFEKLTKEYADLTQLLELRAEMTERMEKDFEAKLRLNDDLSQHLCKKIIGEFFNDYDLPSFLTLDDINESMLKEHK